MNLTDSEEIQPLLKHHRTESDLCLRRYTLPQLNKKKSSNSEQAYYDISKSDASEDSIQLEDVKNLWDSNSRKVYVRNKSKKSFSDYQVTYSWKNLSVYVPVKRDIKTWKTIKNLMLRKRLSLEKSKPILKNVYGLAQPGELLAVMGPSGAGKTTLLNALMCRSVFESVTKGFRYLNGYLINSGEMINKISAYVEQENMFLGNLTVKEHLIFQSLVRMDRTVSYINKLKRIEEVIGELGLEKCQDTVIGFPGGSKGISGGERKRLSFASEILTNPPLLFCDEPTSGVDSFMALSIVNILKSLATKGKTIVCTIHQPSSEIYALFDKILLLSEGRTAFIGKPKDAISFFTELGAPALANYNPADFFMQMLAVVPGKEESCREKINFVCSSFDQSIFGLELAARIDCDARNQAEDHLFKKNWHGVERDLFSKKFTYKAPWLSQFRALFWRSWINVKKEPLLVKVRLFQTVVLSLVVGVLYHQQELNEDGVMNINGVLFTFLTNMTFQNLFGVISAFCCELPIFLKEHTNKLYRVDAYFWSKTLAEIPIFLAIPIIFTSITYFWINLNPKLNHYILTTLILIFVANVAISFGYFISCISKNVVMALSIGPPVIIPFLLFGGFLLNIGTIPEYFKWLSFLSWFKYGNEALLINQWSDIYHIECNRLNSSCPKNGKIILNIYNFQEENFIWDFVCLILLIILFRLLAFLALILKTKSYRNSFKH